MSCIVAQRQKAHHAAAVIKADERVLDATIVGPTEDPTGQFLLDIVVESDGVPTGLFDELAFSLDLRDVSPQGDWRICHAAV